MARNHDLVVKASEYVSLLYKEKLPTWAVYHNIDHVTATAAGVEEIGQGSKLPRADLEIVLLAAWFHDTGYIETVDGHEQKSAEIARRFLADQRYPQEKTEKVIRCILATKIPRTPTTLLEEVLCDADNLHIGRKKLMKRTNLMRTEKERITGKPISDVEWLNSTIDFIAQHPFYTKYAQTEYAKQRTKNLIRLQKRLREASHDEETAETERELRKEKLERQLEKVKMPERGIQTMFRVTARNHIDLSSIADNKANMMISTNALIMTLLVALFGRGITEKLDPHLTIPTLLLMAVSMVTITFAILATRPKITAGTFTKDDIRQKKANLLFFGNFHNMNLEDFQWGVTEMMKDADYLYGSMTKDFYYLGLVLGKKYKYLRICYNVFMYGFIAAVTSFAIAFIY